MSGSRVLVAMLACLLLGIWAGRLFGPPAIEFPAAGETLDATEMERAVGEALAEPRGFPRASTLIRLFEGLSTENVEGAARALDARASHHDPVDLQLFLTAWAHLDPVGAMQAVQSWVPRSRGDLGLRIVMREWAASGAAIEAGAFFQTIEDAEVRRVAAGPLIRGWALAGDAEGARRLALDLWTQKPRLDVTEALVRGVVHTQGAAGALEMIAELGAEGSPLQGFDRRLTHVVLSLSSTDDPAAAAKVYADFENRGQAGALGGSLSRIANVWSKRSPRDAVIWLAERSASVERDAALAEAMRAWALLDYDEAGDWMAARRAANLSDSATQVALVPFIRRMAQLDPVTASGWVAMVEDAERRAVLVNRVAFFWAPVDRPAAERWVDSLGLSPASAREARAAMDHAESGPPAQAGP